MVNLFLLFLFLVYLFSQEPYKSSDLMCADDWHANNEGRAWRTEELYQLSNDKLIKKSIQCTKNIRKGLLSV